MRDFLFVMGLGRSGTTALTRMLTEHHGIALGLERYKGLWWDRIEELTPSRFEHQRFFDFSDGLTNLTPETSEWLRRHYAALAEKFPQARYVGDKLNRVLVPEVLANFPTARFIIIVREVKATAHSWDARAKNPDDTGWAANKDAVAAAGAWNRSLQKTLVAARNYPDRVSIVEYESVFADPAASALRATLRRLDLDWDDGIAASFEAAHLRYRQVVANKPRELPDEVRAYIEDTADLRRWRRVNRLAV